MTSRYRQILLEKGKMPKKFSVKSGDKSAAGGLTSKGVKRYRAANPGSKLKTAVTTEPSKLKKGSKAANRRKSFCSRMGGMKKKLTSKKTASDPDSRINKALRKWNCSTDVNPTGLSNMVEQSRLALAEAVLNALQEKMDDPMVTTPASIEQGGGDPKQYQQTKATKEPKKTTKSKNRKRLQTLGKSGGKHHKDGTPVNVSPNHPDYLKKKLYKRGVKPKGYGKEGESKEGMSTEEINKKGVRGHEKKIAQKKSDIRMDMGRQILKARQRRQAKGKSKKLGPGALATIARRAKDRED